MNNYCSVSDSCQSQCSECIRGPKGKGRTIFILWHRSHGYKSCVSNTNTTAAVDNDISIYGPRSKVQGPRSKVQGFVKKSLLRHNFAAQISKHIDQSLHSTQRLQKRLYIQRRFWFSFLRFARENSHRADLDLPNSSEIQIEIASNLELPPKSICPYKYNNL